MKITTTKKLGIGWSTPIPGKKKPLHCCAKVKSPTLIQSAIHHLPKPRVYVNCPTCFSLWPCLVTVRGLNNQFSCRCEICHGHVLLNHCYRTRLIPSSPNYYFVPISVLISLAFSHPNSHISAGEP